MELVPSGALCPLRIRNGVLETLVQRREFWNYKHDRPMRFPGEWMFSGGMWEEKDSDLAATAFREFCKDSELPATAFREFCEETGYNGRLVRAKHLRTAEPDQYNEYHIEFYAAIIDPDADFEPPARGEVLAVEWMKPAAALSRLWSREFDREQRLAFRRFGLDDPKHGKYARKTRELPVQNMRTLGHIMEHRELYEWVAEHQHSLATR
jgi:8-oxo-dGTP pyrophosphatase MutT (NUDIX family)